MVFTLHLQLILVILNTFLAKSHGSSSHRLPMGFREMPENRSVFIAALPFKPFISQNQSGHFYAGIEFELMKTIAEIENFELQFESTTLGSYQQKSNEIDIIVGGLFPNASFTDKYTISNSYYQDDMTWCIQKSDPYPKVLNFFLLATPECFILIIFGVGYGTGLVLYIIIQFDVEYKQRNQRDWHYTTLMITLPAVIGVNQRYLPGHIIVKLLYFVIIATCVVFWQVFFWNLIKVLQDPIQRPQISTINEIISNNFRLCGSTEVRSLISFDQKYKWTQVSSYYLCEDLDRCLEHLMHDDNSDLAVGGSRQRILNSRFYEPSNIFCLDEKIVSFQPTLLINRNSKFKSKVNKIIRYAFEGGLFVKWDRDNQKRKYNKEISSILPMSIFDLSPAFVFLIIVGNFLAILSFFVEHLTSRKLKNKPESPIWKFLAKFFDGKRYYLMNLSNKLPKNNSKI